MSGPAQPAPPAPGGHAARGKNWPPQDPPMFWITFLTFLAVLVYTGLTWKTNSDSNQGSVIQNRPYIVAQGINVLPIGDPTDTTKLKEFRAAPGFVNIGNTPAIHVNFTMCDPIVRDNDSPPSLSCTVQDKAVEATTVGPKQPMQLFGAVVKPDDMFGTTTGKKFVYVFGYVKYKDAIGGGEEYQTKFCSKVVRQSSYNPSVVGTADGLSSTIGYIAFTCNDANWTCVDRECLTK